MKIIIAGSRTITNKKDVAMALMKALQTWRTLALNITCIVSGGAKGVDKLGEEIAKDLNLSTSVFPANWKKYGKRAGYLRNVEMGNYADALIAVWDGKSKGTNHMINIMKELGKKIYIYKVDVDETTNTTKIGNRM